MPKAASVAESVLADLGFVLFMREDSGALRLCGRAPRWLNDLWPALEQADGVLPVAAASPFLENFLVDAEESWRQGGSEQAKSGPWIEPGGNGAEAQLEATAMTVEGRPILLLERLGEAFEAKKSVLQRARETVIAHQRLNSEIQKNEILLHCVADEMTAALANIITSLRLIELEENGPRTKLLLGLATRATQEQQTLIHRILGVFENELRGVYGPAGEAQAGGTLEETLRQAREMVAPLFADKGVRLEIAETPALQLPVQLDPAQLQRVILNLLENALERSPSGDSVLVRAEEEGNSLLLSFVDRGELLAPDTCADLFARWDPAERDSARAALRLHFCRIVVENCGGEIGCGALPAGRNEFWIRLTKDAHAA